MTERGPAEGTAAGAWTLPGPGRGVARPALVFAIATLCVAALVSLGGTASAHFLLDVNIRIFHVVHEPDRIRLLARLPMPWLVADKLGPESADGTRPPAPYTTNRIEDGALVHYLDADAFRRSPEGLARILAGGLVLETGGEALQADVGRVRAWPAREQAPFARLDEAEAALSGPVYPAELEVTYAGDTVVDVELLYPIRGPVTGYTLRSTLNPGLPGQDETANLLLDHAAAPPLVFRVRGPMAAPVEVSRSALKAAWTFIEEGVRHILEGRDHVLFVLCLVLGATAAGALAWRITGFTIGHSVTLSLGFFGYVPEGAWFIPLVETGIALSILYAAAAALAAAGHHVTTVITALLGLLHGLGFSFVLGEILKLDAPNLWQSLLAFNAGIEIGQLLIALAVWPILALIAKRLPERIVLVRWAVALPCIVIATVWTGERAMQFFSSL